MARRPTASDLAWWSKTLRAQSAVGDASLAALAQHVRVIVLAPGQTYLAAGESAERVGLVRSGILREMFILEDGSERTRAFAIEGDFSGSLSDLLRGGPARTSVVAEVSSRVLTVPWSLVVELTRSDPAWNQLLHRVTERLYLAKAEREFELLALDAEERYRRFRERFALLEASVTQRHVASYLGITPEHLSRIRSRSRSR